MDRRNMLKKFLVPRTAFVRPDSGTTEVRELPATEGAGETVASEIRWQGGDDHNNDLIAAPAEYWSKNGGELVFSSNKKEGLLHLQGMVIDAIQNVCDVNVLFRFMSPDETETAVNGYVGFCFGASVNDSSFDENPVAGITGCGHLFIEGSNSERRIPAHALVSGICLHLSIVPQRTGTCRLRIKALDTAGNTIDMLKADVTQLRVFGAVSLVVQTGAAHTNTNPFVALRKISVQQKRMAASGYNSRPLDPAAEHRPHNTESFHHSYKTTEQT